jgi:hypothetical protein
MITGTGALCNDLCAARTRFVALLPSMSCHLARTDDCTDEDIASIKKRRARLSDVWGCIKVTIARGDPGLKFKLRYPQRKAAPQSFSIPGVTKGCEEIVNDHHISHATK